MEVSPMALSKAELEELIDQASVALQRIQDDQGPEGKGGKVRFPRGYLKKVNERIHRVDWIHDNTLKRNLCYHFIFSDVLRWLLNRTDLNGIARGMVVKQVITLMGSIVESLTMTAMSQLGQGKRNYARRLDYLSEHTFIDQGLKDELLWLWKARAGVHIYEITNLELEAYEVTDSNRAVRATSALVEALPDKMIASELDVIEV
jgi:hypothetical protein